jgi:hypothetical protein
LDRRENTADIDLAIHSHVCGDGYWRCTEPLETTKPALECGIVGTRRYEERRGNAAAPCLANIIEKLAKSCFNWEPRGKARKRPTENEGRASCALFSRTNGHQIGHQPPVTRRAGQTPVEPTIEIRRGPRREDRALWRMGEAARYPQDCRAP